AGTAAVAGVWRFRRPGHGSEPEVHAVARRHQGQRAIVTRERRVLGAVADAGLWTVDGERARIGAGQPASQARVLRKLGPQPLEHGTGFGPASEGVQRVGREPAAAETQAWVVRRLREPFED